MSKSRAQVDGGDEAYQVAEQACHALEPLQGTKLIVALTSFIATTGRRLGLGFTEKRAGK